MIETTSWNRLVRLGTVTKHIGGWHRYIYRWVCEEQIALAVERPSAIMSIAKLPVS